MILVIGSALIKPEHMGEAVRLALEHVRRSRMEAGCLSHNVSQDAEDARRLVFVERWADAAALRAHFRVPASIGFVKALGPLCAQPPEMALYEAAQVQL